MTQRKELITETQESILRGINFNFSFCHKILKNKKIWNMQLK